MSTRYPFTPEDRADHDRLLEEIHAALRRERGALYDAAVAMAEVRDRELWKLDHKESLADWVFFHYGIEERQMRKYLAIRDGLTREQVEHSRYSIDMLERVALARAALQPILLKLGEEVVDGRRLKDKAITTGRWAGEAVLDTLGVEFAVAETERAARAWTPEAAPELPPVEQLQAALKVLVKVDGSLEALLAMLGEDPQAEPVLRSLLDVAGRLLRRVEALGSPSVEPERPAPPAAAVDCRDEPAKAAAGSGDGPAKSAVDCQDEPAKAAAGDDAGIDDGQQSEGDEDYHNDYEDDEDEEEDDEEEDEEDEEEEEEDILAGYDPNTEEPSEYKPVAVAIVAAMDEQEQRVFTQELGNVARGAVVPGFEAKMWATWERYGLEAKGIDRGVFEYCIEDLCGATDKGDLFAIGFLVWGKPVGWATEMDHLQAHRFLLSALVETVMKQTWRLEPPVPWDRSPPPD